MNFVNSNYSGGFSKLDVESEWKRNADAHNNAANYSLLEKLITDSYLTDEKLYQFLVKQHIRPQGRWFENNMAKPTKLALRFAQVRKMNVHEFFHKFQQAYGLDSFNAEWKRNADIQDNQANKLLLKRLISDHHLPDEQLYQFLINQQIRPDGGWFFNKKYKAPTELAKEFLQTRGMNIDEFFKKFQQLSPKTEEIATPIVSPATTATTFTAIHEIKKPKTLETVMKDLETQYADLSLIIRSITPSLKISIDTLNSNEIAHLNQAQAKVAHLETHLKNKYEKDFSNLGWHGRSSFQRIVWQDQEFVKAIQDPLVIKAILINAANKQEENLSSGSTLSGLMFYGLGTNRLSYLISVSPNWENKPAGVSWDYLQRMRLPSNNNNPETPRKVTYEYLEDINQALSSLKEVLSSSAINSKINFSAELSVINTQITHASIADLIRAFKQIINNDNKIFALTYSSAGSSTCPDNMAGQCYEVMMSYPSLLDLNKGDHAAVLGYGLVSHVLDAKHLAAIIYMAANPNSSYVKLIYNKYGNKLDAAKEYLNNLLNDASAGKLDANASHLLKIRLQQLMSTLVENHSNLGLSVSEISTALKS
jgi:hypothetical protein